MKKLRNLIALAMLGFALSNSTSLDFINKKNPQNLDYVRGLEKIVSYQDNFKTKKLIEKVKLIGNYDEEEKKDIEYVLDKYENYIGDISKFNLEIEKVENKKDSEKVLDLKSEYSPIEQLDYSFNALTDLKNGKIKILSKKIIDKTYEWEKMNNKIPKGEEGKIHDFKWILSHEIAHALSIKLGYINDLKNGYSYKKDSFVSYFSDLMKEIKKYCAPLGYQNHKWEEKRPEGFPSQRAYFGNSGELSNNCEAYAEYCAYIVLDKDYAKEDIYLNKVCELIKKDFENIKKLIKNK
jgi:hypothetical protein